MFDKELSYIQQDEIGCVLIEGLTLLYQKQPERPVEFLANWLHSQVELRKREKIEHEKTKEFEITKRQYKDLSEKAKVEVIKKHKIEEAHTAWIAKLVKTINDCELTETIVNTELFNYMREVFRLNQVILAEFRDGKIYIRQGDRNNIAYLANKEIPNGKSSLYDLVEGEDKIVNNRFVTYGDINHFENHKFLKEFEHLIKEKEVFFPKEEKLMYNHDEVDDDHYNNNDKDNEEKIENVKIRLPTEPEDKTEEEIPLTNEQHIEQILDKDLAFVKTYKQIDPESSEKPPLTFKTDSDILYIEDVVDTNKQVYFFDVPKFGSQLAIKLIINQYNNIESVDDYKEKLMSYKIHKSDFLAKEKDEKRIYEAKLHEMRENNEDTTELEQAYNERMIDPTFIELPKSIPKHLILVFDNMGTDELIGIQNLNRIYNISTLLEKKWNITNFKAMQIDELRLSDMNERYNKDHYHDEENDVNNDLKNAESEIQDLIREVLEENVHEETGKVKASEIINPDLLKTFFRQQKILQLYKELLKKHLHAIFDLKQLHYIKHSEVFEYMLLLLGRFKSDINIALKTVLKYDDLGFDQHNPKCLEQTRLTDADVSDELDWKKFKSMLNESLFSELFIYDYTGEKHGEYKDYSKIDKINKALGELNQDEIKDYYYPLFALLRYLIVLTDVRLTDVRKRRERTRRHMAIREERLIAKEKREEQKNIEMELAKEEFYASKEDQVQPNSSDKSDDDDSEPQQPVEFDEAKWLTEWEDKNLDIYVADELKPEIDCDISETFVDQENEE